MWKQWQCKRCQYQNYSSPATLNKPQTDGIIMRTIFPDSSPHLVTDLLKKNCVGLFLQKSFLSVEKWVSSHLCSGTQLLTQSLNSEAAHLLSVAVLEKLFSFVPLPSCSKTRGALTQLQLQRDVSLFSPLCWTSGAGGPEPLPSCLWGEQGWQPALDPPVVGHREGVSKHSTPAWAPHAAGWARSGVCWGKLVPQTADDLSALHSWSPTCSVVPLLASMTNAAITCQDLSALWTDSWQCEFLSLKSFCAGILQAIYWNLFFLSGCFGMYALVSLNQNVRHKQRLQIPPSFVQICQMSVWVHLGQ